MRNNNMFIRFLLLIIFLYSSFCLAENKNEGTATYAGKDDRPQIKKSSGSELVESINRDKLRQNSVSTTVTYPTDFGNVVPSVNSNSNDKATTPSAPEQGGKQANTEKPLQILNSETAILDYKDFVAKGAKKPKASEVEIKTEYADKPTTQLRKRAKSSDYSVPEPGARVKEEKVVNEKIETTVTAPSPIENFSKDPSSSFSDGNFDNSSAIVLNVIQGVNEIVPISKSDLNRFVLPFDKVRVKTAAEEDSFVSKIDGNIVYVGATKRTGVFFTEVGSDRAISITLVPDDIPPRDIYVKFNRSQNIPSSLYSFQKGADSAKSKNDPSSAKSHPHVEHLKEILRDLALNKLPSGFSIMDHNKVASVCFIPGLSTTLGQYIEGPLLGIFVYHAKNKSKTNSVTIDEQYCYKRGVLAVSAWKNVVVPPNGETEIFVVVNNDVETPSSSSRPSLIGNNLTVED